MRRRSAILIVSLLTLIAFGTAPAPAAVTVVFSDFSTSAGLQLNGNAQAGPGVGNVLRLVPATTNESGSAFSTAQVNASDFSTVSQFRLSDRGGITDGSGQAGADGFTFTLQTVANTAGGSGGGLGYQGLSPSVAVEFDTFANTGTPIFDPSSNHLGIDVNGSVVSVQTADVAPDFDNGNLWTAWIDYNNATKTLDVRVSETALRPALPTLSRNIDIFGVLQQNTAFVGFTAGTGGAFENQDIVNWQYNDTFSPITTPPGTAPEPSSLVIFSLLSLCGGLAAYGKQQRLIRA
jgi:legume-like lectin family protein